MLLPRDNFMQTSSVDPPQPSKCLGIAKKIPVFLLLFVFTYK